MQEAIELALENVRTNNGGPFGAVAVLNGSVIARGVNRVTALLDPTAHAEIVTIRSACKVVGSHQLSGVDLYTTCEPCPMCLGAIYWTRPDRVFYAATRVDAADAGFDDARIYEELAMSPANRSLPMKQLLRKEALAIFESWSENEDRIPY